ncbi:MAG: DUF4159 domain-containing protein [Bacteroidetes bacterium]|jgi:hypothetical protein|nr:DUF4159 domain-containing protein [Bacteroidota bacterium]
MFRSFKFIFQGVLTVSLIFSLLPVSLAQNEFYQLAVLKYRGGGDWYSNPTAVPNLVSFCNKELGMQLNEEVASVDVGSPELFDFPWVHMTGHGNVVLSTSETRNLRLYLEAGGFLHISDNYGMDPYVRREMRKVFTSADWIELPWSHAVFHSAFDFEKGLPKIHEHDDLPPRGYGLFHEGRLVVFYDVESDLGDGWEDWQVHRDPESIRQLALRMGANLVQTAMSGSSL